MDQFGIIIPLFLVCEVTSVMSDSVRPHRRQPTRLPVPGILQARTLEWVPISFSNAWKWKVKVKLLSRVQLFETPWTAAYQAPPSMGSSRQEYWSGVPYSRLEPHNNHLIGVWMPGSFIDQRERSNEELKSKGRIQRVMQWGSKVEREFSLAKHLQGNGLPLEGVC